MKILLIIIGLLSMILGAIGIFVPVLPTTPLLLLAAACFMRSSQRLHRYLMNHRLFGAYIRSYQNGTLSPVHKVGTLIFMWVGMGISAWLIHKPVMAVVFLVIALGVTWHLVTLKPRKAKTATGDADASTPTKAL